VLVLAVLCAAPGLAGAQVQPYGANDFGGFRNILPPGANGLVDAAQLAAFEATGAKPPHNDDQLAMYSNLTTAAPNIQESQIGEYFKDATFGVQSGNVERTETPERGATIEWDNFGVPHIYGDTRSELEFAVGWATAEDRLFLIDVLRHAGDGDLASFAGGSNASMDEGTWASDPYTPADLEQQVTYGLSHLPDGQQILSDATSFIDGINAYITAAESPLNLLTMLPAEYPVLGLTPKPFTLEDLVAIGSIVGAELGNGGGAQLSNAVLYEQLRQRFGSERRNPAGSPQLAAVPKRKRQRGHGKLAAAKPKAAPDHSGYATFKSFDDPADPEAPTTVHGTKFPYQRLPHPSKATLRRIALPDPGSVQYFNHLVAGSLPPAASLARRGHATGTATGGSGLNPEANAGPGLLAFPRGMSNALLVSAKDSVSGHPLAVMGPQVAYFSPEILMEEDIHGPGIDADGAGFPGTNLYVELGHGRDYAWSATSSGENIIDTFAVPLCNPAGGTVSIDSDFYEFHHQCVQMDTLTRTESWRPNFADSTPAGSATFQTLRTAYGLVTARATIKGKPVVYTNLRSTYMHELDSIAGFEAFNDPDEMKNPQQFFDAAYKIGYTFNWFYADDKHIAYFDSGLTPVRAPHTDPLFPTWSTFDWKHADASPDVTPASTVEAQTSESSHPHTVDQPFLTSWNNKQAPAYNDAGTAQEFSSVYRSQLLDNNINGYLASGHKLTLADLINAMGNAGTQDLRGVEVLPYALKVIGTVPSGSPLATPVSELRAWVSSGAHRINREHPGAHGDYDQSAAVRILDAWWPLLVKAEFTPVLGAALLSNVEGEFPINDEPGHGTSGNHLGSSFDVGFYGIVQKDLRAVLGKRVRGPLNRVYCGNGSLRACRAALESSLEQATSETPQQVYPSDGVCPAGDQMCSDSIQFRAIGAVSQPLIEWINRPTFEQADEILGHGPR
jgi:acyl-homoserine lactone acylase PvdQ